MKTTEKQSDVIIKDILNKDGELKGRSFNGVVYKVINEKVTDFILDEVQILTFHFKLPNRNDVNAMISRLSNTSKLDLFLAFSNFLNSCVKTSELDKLKEATQTYIGLAPSLGNQLINSCSFGTQGK